VSSHAVIAHAGKRTRLERAAFGKGDVVGLCLNLDEGKNKDQASITLFVNGAPNGFIFDLAHARAAGIEPLDLVPLVVWQGSGTGEVRIEAPRALPGTIAPHVSRAPQSASVAAARTLDFLSKLGFDAGEAERALRGTDGKLDAALLELCRSPEANNAAAPAGGGTGAVAAGGGSLGQRNAALTAAALGYAGPHPPDMILQLAMLHCLPCFHGVLTAPEAEGRLLAALHERSTAEAASANNYLVSMRAGGADAVPARVDAESCVLSRRTACGMVAHHRLRLGAEFTFKVGSPLAGGVADAAALGTESASLSGTESASLSVMTECPATHADAVAACQLPPGTVLHCSARKADGERNVFHRIDSVELPSALGADAARVIVGAVPSDAVWHAIEASLLANGWSYRNNEIVLKSGRTDVSFPAATKVARSAAWSYACTHDAATREKAVSAQLAGSWALTQSALSSSMKGTLKWSTEHHTSPALQLSADFTAIRLDNDAHAHRVSFGDAVMDSGKCVFEVEVLRKPGSAFVGLCDADAPTSQVYHPEEWFDGTTCIGLNNFEGERDGGREVGTKVSVAVDFSNGTITYKTKHSTRTVARDLTGCRLKPALDSCEGGEFHIAWITSDTVKSYVTAPLHCYCATTN